MARPTLILAAVLALTAGAAPALAADRVLTVTSFDRVRVDGPYDVRVVTGRGPSARVSGAPTAIDRVRIEVQGETLTIRADGQGWGERREGATGPVVIRLTTPELRAASLSGSGSLAIDRMRTARANVALSGSGQVTVANVTADRLDLALIGAGTVRVAGKVADATATLNGAGALDGDALMVADLKLIVSGPGVAKLRASRSANIRAASSGPITVAGQAACTVSQIGSGEVICGKGPPKS